MGSMTVVMLDVGVQDGIEVALSEDEDAIETPTPQSTDKPLRERIGVSRQQHLIPTERNEPSV
jgi:hypothetical protein